MARMRMLRASSNFPSGVPPTPTPTPTPRFMRLERHLTHSDSSGDCLGVIYVVIRGCIGADLGPYFTQTLIIEMRHLDVKRIQRHFLVDGKRQQPSSHGEHKSRSALGVFNFISPLNHAALAHFLFMKIEIGSECRKKELKRGSVVVVAAAVAVVAARQLFGWLGEEDCRLHLEVTDVPIKLSSALLLHSLLFFYSWSHKYNGSIMLPCIVSCIFLAGMDTKHCTRSIFPTCDLEVKHIVSPGPKLKGVLLQKAAFFTSKTLIPLLTCHLTHTHTHTQL